MPAATLIKRRYLFPCTGFLSSVRKHLAPQTALTDDSVDCILVPRDGRVQSRLGSAIQRDTRNAQVGLLENKWPARSRQLIPLVSSSLADGFPTYAVLFTAEGPGAKFGTIYMRSTNSTDTAAAYQLGKEYGVASTNTYTHTAGQAVRYKVIPVPYSCGGATPASSNAMGLTRGVTALNRQFFTSGARRLEAVGNWVYSPDLYGSPIRWNRAFNDSVTGTNAIRIQPWGTIPPLYPSQLGTQTSATAREKYNWADGDAFYATVVFEMEDGSFSAPWINRPPGASGSTTITNSQGGLFIIGTVRSSATAGATMTYYETIQWRHIPLGPPGCIARHLCRSNKVNLSSTNQTSAAAQDIGPSGGGRTIQELNLAQIRVTARIGNNTQTTYVDANGNDTALLVDDGKVVRFDRIWPPSSRYCFQFDQRVAVGYRRLNPAAIVLSPLATSNPRTGATAPEYNIDDATTPPSTTGYCARVTNASNLELARCADIGAPAAPILTTISIATATLQQVVDAINATVASGGADAREWVAQLAPGVDLNILASNLAVTAFTTSVGSGTLGADGVTLTVSTPTGTALGMRVVGNLGTGTIPANTYIAQLTAGVVTLSQTGTPGSITNVHFFVDTGDDFMFTGTTSFGFVRAFSPSFPAVLALGNSFLEGLPHYEQKDEVLFTMGGPGVAAAATQSFVVGNRRRPPQDAGIFMGGAPLIRGAVLCYSKAIYTLENRYAGSTGADADYRMYPLNQARGALSAPEAVGEGWVAYWTRDGIVATDGESEMLLSGDIHNPADQAGELAYEINQSARAVAEDTDTSNAHLAVNGTRLHATYRSASTTSFTDRRQIYDFSRTIQRSRLDELVDDNSRTHGWSAPLRQPHVVIGSVDRPDSAAGGTTAQRRLYGTVDLGFDVPICTVTATLTTVTSVAGFSSVVVGMGVIGPGIPSGTSVATVGSSSSITLSVAATVTGTPTLSFTRAGITGMGRVDEIDRASQFLDDAESVTVASVTSSGNTCTASSGDFSQVALGAIFSLPAALNGRTVTAKAADQLSVTFSGGAVSTSGAATLWGKEIEPQAYLSMDAVDSPKGKKCFHNVTAIYKHTPTGGVSNTENSTLSLRFSRDKNRASVVSHSLSPHAVTDEYNRLVLELSQDERAPGEVGEFEFRHDGRGSSQVELIGLEAEIEVLDSLS